MKHLTREIDDLLLVTAKQRPCNLLFPIGYSQLKGIWKWKTTNLDFILVSGDKIYKDLSLNRLLVAEYWSKKLKYNSKTIAEIVFTTSVSGFLELSNKEWMKILAESLDKAKSRNWYGCFTFCFRGMYGDAIKIGRFLFAWFTYSRLFWEGQNHMKFNM